MKRSWISFEVPRPTHYECLNLVTSQDKTLTHCLTLKVWNESCKARCPYFKAGAPGSLEKLEAKGYLVNCLKFSRKLITRKQTKAYCKLHLMSEPYCQKCTYPRDR